MLSIDLPILSSWLVLLICYDMVFIVLAVSFLIIVTYWVAYVIIQVRLRTK